MKTDVRIFPPVGKQVRFPSPRLLRFRGNSFYKFIFTPKEVNATRRFEMVILACEIQARLISIQHVLAEGTLLISVGQDTFVFEAQFRPWNDEAFEILSMAIDELTTLLLRFRARYPTEEFVTHLTLDPEPCAPI